MRNIFSEYHHKLLMLKKLVDGKGKNYDKIHDQ